MLNRLLLCTLLMTATLPLAIPQRVTNQGKGQPSLPQLDQALSDDSMVQMRPHPRRGSGRRGMLG